MNKMMTARTICMIAGLLISIAAASSAQSGMRPNPDGSSPAAPTPDQQAQIEQLDQLDQAAALAITAGHYDQAVANAQQAESLYIGDPAAPLLVAEGLEGQKKWNEALKEYQNLVDHGDVLPNVLMPYALLLLNKGQWSEALAAYEKALPFVPGSELMRSHKDFSADTPDVAALAAAIHTARSLIFANDTIVSLYTHHLEYDNALAESQKALDLASDSALVNYYHGLVLQKVGRKADAKAAFQKAADLDQGSDVKAAAQQELSRL